MNEKEQAALEKLLSSKNYRNLCPDTVSRIFAEALPRYPSVKQADQAARSALHQLSGAFMTAEQLALARKCLRDDLAGDPDALARALRLHASTRERPGWADAYARVMAAIGRPALVLDLACGLNPLCLGALGLPVWGLDVHGGAADLVNQWAGAHGWAVSCRCGDLLCDPPLPRADLALMMKLLPVLERQRCGFGARLLADAPARWKLVTFPTRTLGGRQVGMGKRYTAWLEANLPPSHTIVLRFEQDDELYFLLEDTHG